MEKRGEEPRRVSFRGSKKIGVKGTPNRLTAGNFLGYRLLLDWGKEIPAKHSPDWGVVLREL